MDLQEKVEKALVALGSTSAEIAEALFKKGIKGTPGDPDCCPIANYLKAEIGEKHISVATFIHVYGRSVLDSKYTMVTPPACSYFINYFDGGEYPELRY